MNHFEYSIRTQDEVQLYGQGWEPEHAPSAVICLVHGLGEHSGRYVHLAERLAQAGFGMFAYDLRGHGKSSGQRGHSPSFERLMEDLDIFLSQAAQRYPGLPRFLYGHSLGGLLVLNYILRRKPTLAGVIVTGAGLRTSLTRQTVKLAFVHTLQRLFPTLAIPTGLDARHLSHDDQIYQAYIHDPLVHDRSSLQMANDSLNSIPWVFEHARELDLPLLLMHGSDDSLTYPKGSQEFYDLVKGDVSLKIWEGLFHEIHNEPEKDEVMTYLIDWLEKKMPVSGPGSE